MSKYIELKIPAPRWQGIVVFGFVVLMMLGGKFIAKSPLFPWLTSGACLLLFIVFNNGASIFADHFYKYVQESMMVFIGLLLASGLLAWLISGYTIHEAEPYRTIYIILIMAYFTLCALCLLIRSVVDFLLSKDKKRE